MQLHAFVAMPYGTKQGIDFNEIYSDYIRQALEQVGFEVFRADEELRSGDIRVDMFQELLLADLVVVDLSIDNPNVWYELGVRHALRPRGVVQVQSQREHMPFDVYVDRALRYRMRDGHLDPDHLNEDRKMLATVATETVHSWRGRKVSPVYQLLSFLEPPAWKTLRVGGVNEFWEAYESWESRVRIAQKARRIGDILVLADEVPTRLLEVEARIAAGSALMKLTEYRFALEQYEKALEIDPDNLDGRRQKGTLLGRLKKYPEADVWLRDIIKDHPEDAESWGLLGRVEKDAWLERWRKPGYSQEQMRTAATAESAQLRQAIAAYMTGFRKDPRNYYPGINALTLSYLLEHLTGRKQARQERDALSGGVLWAVNSVLATSTRDYWARVTLADVELLSTNSNRVELAYREAVAVSEGNWFALDSSRQQLSLLSDLGFRPLEVAAAQGVFDQALAGLGAPDEPVPNRVFLFSGHMIDRPDRPVPRFPAAKRDVAAAAIASRLDELGAGKSDLAFCGGACGGDLLFAQACLDRGLGLRVRIPFDEPTFLQKSVTFAGEFWQDLYFQIKNHPAPRSKILVMPEVLGSTPAGVDPFVRNNLWQLYTALAWGPEKVHFICLWNRQGGDGPGGTKNMYDIVTRYSGQTYVIDTNTL